MDTAVYEQGGPLERHMTAGGAGTGYGHQNGHLTGGENGHKTGIPDSGNKGLSGIAKEFHIRNFQKKKEAGEVRA